MVEDPNPLGWLVFTIQLPHASSPGAGRGIPRGLCTHIVQGNPWLPCNQLCSRRSPPQFQLPEQPRATSSRRSSPFHVLPEEAHYLPAPGGASMPQAPGGAPLPPAPGGAPLPPAPGGASQPQLPEELSCRSSLAPTSLSARVQIGLPLETPFRQISCMCILF